MDWEKTLKHYQKNHIDNIEDEDLLNEAIVTCENIFELKDQEELLHHSRPLAISFLALKHEEHKKKNNMIFKILKKDKKKNEK